MKIQKLSRSELSRLEEIEAAEPAEESLRERVIDAIDVTLDSLGVAGDVSIRASEHIADAVLEVVRP